MKQPVILLAWSFFFFYCSANAQIGFEETYKKAYGFTNIGFSIY